MGLIKPNKGTTLPTLSNPAGAGQVKEGYEVIGADGTVITGTNTDKALPSLSNPASAENVDSGYQVIDATGEAVTGTSNKVDTSAATATAADIASGKTAGTASGLETGTYVQPYDVFYGVFIATNKATSVTVPNYFSKSGGTIKIFGCDELYNASLNSNLTGSCYENKIFSFSNSTSIMNLLATETGGNFSLTLSDSSYCFGGQSTTQYYHRYCFVQEF